VGAEVTDWAPSVAVTVNVYDARGARPVMRHVSSAVVHVCPVLAVAV
jgi:hypothetical protein